MDIIREWCNYKEKFDAIMAADMTDVEKLAQAFGGITELAVSDAERQAELARASGDSEEAVRQQIKMETMKHARKIFRTCCWYISGKQVWNEEKLR